MRRSQIPDLERLDEVLSYDSVTGDLRWRTHRSGTAKAGSLAGTIDRATQGVAVVLDGRRYQAHHLIWYMQHRIWPAHQILFRDKDPTNLRLLNLYSAEETWSEHPKAVYARNRRERRERGRVERMEIQRLKQPETISPIALDARTRKWSVLDPIDSRRVLMQFDTPDEARDFAKERERVLHWLDNHRRTFKIYPTDEAIRAGSEPFAESYAEIAEIVAYDPDTGHFYYRDLGPTNRGQLRADFINTSGRRVVSLFGRYFSVAMLAWFLTHRQWPKPKSIGWRDGNKENNKLSNLMLLKVQK